MDIRSVLLVDETNITEQEMEKRIHLGELIVSRFPMEVVQNLSVFQPSVGCLNRCAFCSQEAGVLLRMMDGSSVRTIGGALKYALYIWGQDGITLGRKYKPGIIFPYLDNDIGSYPYLIDYLVVASSLGATVRFSSIGWSRKNQHLNKMHREIAEHYSSMLAGVRFSLTAYSSSWNTNRDEFIEDFINMVKTYQFLLGLSSSEGLSGACIDVDFKPDITGEVVTVKHFSGMEIWKCGEYIIRVDKNVNKSGNRIAALLKCSTLVSDLYNQESIAKWEKDYAVELGEIREFKNEDGYYYGFYSVESVHPTDGIFIFLQNSHREGGVFDARWPLREIKSYIDKMGISVDELVDIKSFFNTYLLTVCNEHRKQYLLEKFFPIFSALCKILVSLDLPLDNLFNQLVVRDRGMIRNSGRAFYQFKQIASGPNIMVVPDPVLSVNNTDEVWRIFFDVNHIPDKSDTKMGRKSSCSVDDMTDEKCYLIAWKVDAASHSHLKENVRSEYYIPISEFINDVQVYTVEQGKKAELFPGI